MADPEYGNVFVNHSINQTRGAQLSTYPVHS